MERLISVTDLYDTLSKKIDKETAKSLTDFVRITVDDKFQSAKDELVTKDFLRAELSELSERLSKEFTKELSNSMLKTIFAILIPIALMFLGFYLKK